MVGDGPAAWRPGVGVLGSATLRYVGVAPLSPNGEDWSFLLPRAFVYAG